MHYKNFLNFPVGSVQYIYFHGLWRLKRGRVVSAVPYRNEHNPRKAFALASCDIQGWLKTVDKNIASAKFWLKTLRTPASHNFPTDLLYIRDHVHKAGITLAEIGTSEEELVRIAKSINIQRAKYWLNTLRTPANHNFPSDLNYVRDYVQQAGVTLAEIGTSEEEFIRIAKNLNIQCAKFWLKILRSPSAFNTPSDLSFVYDYAQKAGVTLAELGTSEEEMERFRTRKVAA